MEIIKYQGNNNYIIGLCKDEKNKKYVFFSYVDRVAIEQETEERDFCFDTYNKIKFHYNRQCILKLLLKEKDNNFIHLLEIEDEKEYTTITKFLEYIL